MPQTRGQSLLYRGTSGGGQGRPLLLQILIIAAMSVASCGGREGPAEGPSPQEQTPVRLGANPPSEGADPLVGAAPPKEYWAEMCNHQLGRVHRCGETVNFDTLEACLSDKYNRMCAELIDAKTAARILDYLKTAPCRTGSRIQTLLEDGVFRNTETFGEERIRQDSCLAKTAECSSQRFRCIAPLLKQPYRSRVFECYALGCDNFRKCVETVLEAGGCP